MLLLLFVGGAIYWYLHPNRLVASPGDYNGPVGSRVEFKVENVGSSRSSRRTSRARRSAVVLDPAVARFDPTGDSAATLTGPGKTLIRFHLGDLEAERPAGVRPGGQPGEDLHRAGQCGAGRRHHGAAETGRRSTRTATKVDLTDAAEWTAQNDGIVFSYERPVGRPRPRATPSVAARYRADAQRRLSRSHGRREGSRRSISKSLEAAIDPAPVCVGHARADCGSTPSRPRRQEVLGPRIVAAGHRRSSRRISPRSSGGTFRASRCGSGKLAVTFAGDDPDRRHGVRRRCRPGARPLGRVSREADDGRRRDHRPERRFAQQRADLNDQCQPGGGRDRAGEPADRPGRGERQRRGGPGQPADRGPVEGGARPSSRRSRPARLVVPVDHTIRGRVLGRPSGGRRPERNVEIAPDLVAWPTSGRRRAMPSSTLRWSRCTASGRPSRVRRRRWPSISRGAQASAPVEVVVAPFRLAISPAGPIKLPLGQQMRLQGWANYSGGLRVQVPAEGMKLEEPLARRGGRGARTARRQGGGVEAQRRAAGGLGRATSTASRIRWR